MDFILDLLYQMMRLNLQYVIGDEHLVCRDGWTLLSIVKLGQCKLGVTQNVGSI